MIYADFSLHDAGLPPLHAMMTCHAMPAAAAAALMATPLLLMLLTLDV